MISLSNEETSLLDDEETALLGNEYVVTFIADNWKLSVCVQGVQAENGEKEGDLAIWLANTLIFHSLGFRPLDIAEEIEYYKEPTPQEVG